MALGFLYRALEATEREHAIRRVIAEADAGRLSLDGLLLCHADASPIGSMLTVPGAGRTMMAWPPAVDDRVDPADRARANETLFEAALAFARDRRSRVVQMLLGSEEAEAIAAGRRHGFRRLTQLLYLRRRLDGPPFPSPRSDVEFVPYSAANHAEFIETLAQTYEGSQDCPEITGVRTAQESFESHAAQGEFDPDRWFLLRWKDQWAGCLLLVSLPRLDAMEIAYVGATRDARGNGLGRELVGQSIRVAQSASVPTLTLAVDVRNLPALRIYQSCGFECWDERDVYLVILDPADGKEHAIGEEP